MTWIHLPQNSGHSHILVKMVVNIRSENLMAVNMKINVFWYVVTCSLIIPSHKILILMVMNLQVPGKVEKHVDNLRNCQFL
jgi:hypothetical protein